MAATWEDIRQLQAEFAQAQMAKNAQKLSERNCIELVLRLIDLKLIDVVHTIGKCGLFGIGFQSSLSSSPFGKRP